MFLRGFFLPESGIYYGLTWNLNIKDNGYDYCTCIYKSQAGM
jgi:hypothetical protein